MDKRKAHILCGVIAGAVVVSLFVMNLWLVVHVNTLERQLSSHASTMTHRIGLLEQQIDTQQRGLLERLDQQGSLFSAQQTGLSYADGIVTFSVTVMPKEVRQGESLLLVVGEVSAALSPTAGTPAAYSASVELPFQESYAPAVILLSGAGQRLETLAPIYTDELLQVDTAACWPGQLYNWPGEEGTFYLCAAIDPAEVETLELILRTQDSQAELARFSMQPIGDFPRDQFQEGMFAYAADLGEWKDREGEYQLFAQLTTKGGLLLTGQNSVGEFSSGPATTGSGSAWRGHSSGIETLRPAWPNTDG